MHRLITQTWFQDLARDDIFMCIYFPYILYSTYFVPYFAAIICNEPLLSKWKQLALNCTVRSRVYVFLLLPARNITESD